MCIRDSTYIDRAQSGRSDRRVEFQKMMDHARDNKFKYILIYQYDRFSRNRRHSINYKYELSKLGVTLISVTEPLADSPEKIFLEGDVYKRQLSSFSLNTLTIRSATLACFVSITLRLIRR